MKNAIEKYFINVLKYFFSKIKMFKKNITLAELMII